VVGIPTFVNLSLRLQLREQNHVADAFLAEEHHAQAVNADADAAGGRHAVFERDEKILVQLLLLAAGLMFQRGALRDGIVLLGVGSARASRAVFRASRNTPARE
jgi:hypothetical protein